MCVILAVEKDTKPNLEILQACEKYNNDGAGMAWIDGQHVVWKKGLTGKEVFDLQENIDPPYLIHFRWATSGGVSPYLCHPFPVTRKTGLELAGKIIKGRLLMHNGCWTETEWKKMCKKTILERNAPLPRGEWSDSRAMAWLAHIWTDSILHTLPGKIAVLSPRGIKYYGDKDWKEYNDTGIMCSNLSFTWLDSNWGGWEYFGDNRETRKGTEWPYCDWRCEVCTDPLCEHWDEFEDDQEEQKRFAQEEIAWRAYQAEEDAEGLASDDGPPSLYNNRDVIDMVLNPGRKIHVLDHTRNEDKSKNPCEICNAESISDCNACEIYRTGSTNLPAD